MIKCWVSKRRHSARAPLDAQSAATLTKALNRYFILPPAGESLTAVRRQARYRIRWVLGLSEKAVGIDVDADPNSRAPVDVGEPITNDVLDVQATARMNEQA